MNRGAPPERGAQTYRLPSWALPLVVLAITVPIIGAFMTVGAIGGVAAGAVVTAALIVLAARMSPDEPIEGPPGDEAGTGGILVVLDRDPGDRQLEQLARLAVRAAGDSGETPALRLVAPTRPGLIDRWATDLAEAQADAQLRLVHASAALARAEVDSDARIGDADAVQAVTDELRSFRASRVVVVTAPDSDAAKELARRLRVPLTVLDPTV